MATITLKNIPKILHLEIKKRAEINRRSINSEIITTLERIFGLRKEDPEEFVKKAQGIGKEIRGYLTPDVLQELKSEGRK